MASGLGGGKNVIADIRGAGRLEFINLNSIFSLIYKHDNKINPG